MYKFKKGFSLFEACVVMIVTAIFVAVMANVVSHKSKAKVASEAHGRFECYYDGNTLYQQMFTEGSSTGRVKAVDAGGTATTCVFTPPYYAKYLIMDAVGGGAGGSNRGGGSEGQFVSSFYATILPKYSLSPGKGGAVSTNGGDSTVVTDGDTILTAKGGKATASLENTTVNDILTCNILEYALDEQYDCKVYPTCEVRNGKIYVSFCRTKSSYITKELDYKKVKADGTVEKGNPRYIVNDVYTHQSTHIKEQKYGINDPSVWIYHDISLFSDYDSNSLNPVKRPGWEPKVDDLWYPSLYTMALKMDTTANGDAESPSNLARFIDSMQYKSKISELKVGTGGAKNSAGYNGAILFLW